MQVEFFKYHALENDFLVIDRKRVSAEESRLPRLVRALCARHCGIGADGVLLVEMASPEPTMRIFNADGSEAEVSGNGLRIVAQHLHRERIVAGTSFPVRTIRALNSLSVISERDREMIVQISLSPPRFELEAVPMRSPGRYFVNQTFKTTSGALLGTAVNVGNPHIVFFVDSFNFGWREYGAEVERDGRFPEQTNVEFAIIKSRHRVVHCSWERGVGVTRASGTGAASTVAAGIIAGRLDHKVAVAEPAGLLEIEAPSLDEPILLTGPSLFVGRGVFEWAEDEEDRC